MSIHVVNALLIRFASTMGKFRTLELYYNLGYDKPRDLHNLTTTLDELITLQRDALSKYTIEQLEEYTTGLEAIRVKGHITECGIATIEAQVRLLTILTKIK